MLFSLLHAAAIVTMGTLDGRQLDYRVGRQTTVFWGAALTFTVRARNGPRDQEQKGDQQQKVPLSPGAPFATKA